MNAGSITTVSRKHLLHTKTSHCSSYLLQILLRVEQKESEYFSTIQQIIPSALELNQFDYHCKIKMQ